MKKRERGTTLLELIITLGLITTVACIALPSIRQLLPNYRLTAAARVLIIQIHKAKLQAVTLCTTCYLDFDFDEDGEIDGNCVLWEDRNHNQQKDAHERHQTVWTLDVFPSVAFQACPRELGGPERGPNDTSVQAGGGDGIAFSWGQNRLKFNSNGTSYAGTIYMHSTSGRTYAIRIRPNGLVQLWRHDGGPWQHW